MFVSQVSIDSGTVQSYGLKKRIEAVKNCRNIGKKEMKFNDNMPKMTVDPESYVSSLWTEHLLIVKFEANGYFHCREWKQTACIALLSRRRNCR